MGFKNAFCDDCGAEDLEEYDKDYDGVVRCIPCYLKDEIAIRTHRRNKRMEWLENTHLSEVRKMDAEIKEMQERLDELNSQ